MWKCRMCWKKTDDYYKWAVALWCPTCRKEIDKELRKEQDKPFAFYFAKYKEWQLWKKRWYSVLNVEK